VVKGRILLVDDNEDFLDSTKDVLEDEDYQVLTATSGEDAIRQLGLRDFDVVVMDIKMPGMNGVETLSLVRKRNPKLKVIMCTAYMVENLIRQALEQGAYAVLNKPFEMNLLIRTIENVREPSPCGHVLIADRDAELCAHLQSVLTSRGHKAVVAHDGREALETARTHAFNLLLLDVNLPDISGVEVTRRLRTQGDQTPILILTVHKDDAYIFGLLEAGATGYVLKDDALEILPSAIRSVARGEAWLSPAITHQVVDRILHPPAATITSSTDGAVQSALPHVEEIPGNPLTRREIEVLCLLAEGLDNPAIAQQLVVTTRTIQNHVSNIYSKLGIKSRTEAVLYAIRHELVNIKQGG
jgi:DNA-binding NarL/FixJ family response regulator